MTQTLSRAEFRARYGPWALVAGASEGFGAAWARELAARGCDVVLVARREEQLAALAREIELTHGVATHAVVADLASHDIAGALARAVGAREIGLLVYNAAQPSPGAFAAQRAEDLSRALDVNCRAPLLLAHHFGAQMLARRRGGVILMTSLSGVAGSSWVATYAATKAFDWVLAEGLHHEWKPHGVDVLAAVAGLTDTPHARSTGVQVDAMPAMRPEDAVRDLLGALGTAPYAVAGDANRAALTMLESLPRSQRSAGLSTSTLSLYADAPKRA
ncbi:MAG: SDR family NAD(P)-dependent oxidoreductase [Deltaproteobacteria bacterium]|nr:SDR family NAD(P)-dependent oxidoreductase [Deltaproteobacteria bacterium]